MCGFGRVDALGDLGESVPGDWEWVSCGGEERNVRSRGDSSKGFCWEKEQRNVAAAKQGHGSWRKFFSSWEIPECVCMCGREGEMDAQSGSAHAVRLVPMPSD